MHEVSRNQKVFRRSRSLVGHDDIQDTILVHDRQVIQKIVQVYLPVRKIPFRVSPEAYNPFGPRPSCYGSTGCTPSWRAGFG